MKNLVFSLLFSIIGISVFAQIDSKIAQVKVYTKNAEITRTFTSKIEVGQQELVLSGISLYMDPSSLQVQIEDTENITLLSAKFEINYLKIKKKSIKTESLKDSLETTSTALSWVRDQKAILVGMEDILNKNKALGGEAGFTPIQVIELTNSYSKKLLEIRKEASKLQKEEKTLQKRVKKLQLQLNELQANTNKPDGNIVLLVSAKHLTHAKLKCTYLVENAGWTPLYDLRSKGITKDITLNYKANIFQNTGEDWKQVKMIVSSGNPSKNNNRPILSPLYAGFYEYSNYNITQALQGKVAGLNIINLAQANASYCKNTIFGIVSDAAGPLPGTSIYNRSKGIGVETDFDGNYSLAASIGDIIDYRFIGMENKSITVNYFGKHNIVLEGDSVLDEVVITAYGTKKSRRKQKNKEKDAYKYNTNVNQNQINVEYEITHKQDILSDGKQNLVALTNYKLKTEYKYHAVPKLDKAAFLLAKISDWGQYNLLAGEANLFLEGAYVGKSYINPNVTSDTLLLSLGRDESISIERKELKNYTSSKHIGINKKESFGYEINIKNKKSAPIEIEILDQIPITQNKKIEVILDEKSGAELNEDTGKLIWKYTIKGGQSKKIKLGYTVKYPKGKRIAGVK